MSDAQPSGQILLYPRGDGSPSLEVRLDGETVWLAQAQMAELFQTTPQNITLHLKAIYAEGELDEAATCKDYLQVRPEGKRKVSRNLRRYRLEAILAVGYRVKSQRGTQFCRWVTAILSEYARKGFAMDDSRLKSLGGGNYWKELRGLQLQGRSAGRVSHQQAIAKAEAEYAKYRSQLDVQPSEVETAHLETVKRAQRRIEDKKK